MKQVRSSRSPSRKITLCASYSSTPRLASKLSLIVYQGISSPFVPSGGRGPPTEREAHTGMVLRAFRWAWVGDLIGPREAAAACMRKRDTD